LCLPFYFPKQNNFEKLNSNFQIEFRFWVSFDGKPLLGKGKMDLLRKIDQRGSLRKAAEELRISYRKAYYRIYSMNKAAKQPVVELKRGGKNGGVSEITTYGKKLMKEYEIIEKQLTDFIQNCKFEVVH